MNGYEEGERTAKAWSLVGKDKLEDSRKEVHESLPAMLNTKYGERGGMSSTQWTLSSIWHTRYYIEYKHSAGEERVSVHSFVWSSMSSEG